MSRGLTVIEKDDIEQAWAERRKTVSTNIRLKHSLAADREINQRLPKELALFNKELHKSRLLESKDA